MKKGYLITFEGTEGCGKSTHAKMLEKYLKSLGKRAVLSLEPGGTKLGRDIRKVLLGFEEPLARNAELFLFAADRAQHVSQVIKPALDDGAIVICDRFIDSTVAYQIGGRKLPEELVRYINAVSSGGLMPDLTFLLDVSPMVGVPRAIAASAREKGPVKKVDRFEKEKIAFHNDVRNMYLEIARNDPERIKVIDAEKQDISKVQEEIMKIAKEILNI
ncbi:MAG: dTMP kinase [Candidatus Saganbacteria bacterium]|nr:dTMP kinase [Candidatus Saganbacteria bacterium]